MALWENKIIVHKFRLIYNDTLVTIPSTFIITLVQCTQA